MKFKVMGGIISLITRPTTALLAHKKVAMTNNPTAAGVNFWFMCSSFKASVPKHKTENYSECLYLILEAFRPSQRKSLTKKDF